MKFLKNPIGLAPPNRIVFIQSMRGFRSERDRKKNHKKNLSEKNSNNYSTKFSKYLFFLFIEIGERERESRDSSSIQI